MWPRRPLDDILSCPAKVAVLRTVLRVSAPLSGRKIARRSGVGYSPAYSALQALVASGVLSRQDHGKVKTYTVRDPASPLIAGLRELFDREDQRMRSAVAELAESAPEVRAIVLFGSEARGEARPGSDTDLLMVVDKADPVTVDQVRDACLEVAERHGTALAWHVADLGQLREWEATQDRFWQNVVQDGIWLHGDSLEAIRLRWRPGRAISGRPAIPGK